MLHAEAFTADPIGTQVDPERLVEARAAGTSADELHERAYLGEFAPATPLDLRLPGPTAPTLIPAHDPRGPA
jgi:hypothetical protein